MDEFEQAILENDLKFRQLSVSVALTKEGFGQAQADRLVKQDDVLAAFELDQETGYSRCINPIFLAELKAIVPYDDDVRVIDIQPSQPTPEAPKQTSQQIRVRRADIALPHLLSKLKVATGIDFLKGVQSGQIVIDDDAPSLEDQLSQDFVSTDYEQKIPKHTIARKDLTDNIAMKQMSQLYKEHGLDVLSAIKHGYLRVV